MELKSLPDAKSHTACQKSQHFLTSAHQSVNGVLANLTELRKLHQQKTGRDPRGRLTESHEDLLRAAVLFTGAGLDATLKQLLRDALPLVIDKSPEARDKFQTMVEKELATSTGIVDSKTLAQYLVAVDARRALIERYVEVLTGGSLQSAEEVSKTAGALGVSDKALRSDIEQTGRFFKARNEIAHELDLQHPSKPGDKTRRPRSVEIVDDCSSVFAIAQRLVNAVVDVIAESSKAAATSPRSLLTRSPLDKVKRTIEKENIAVAVSPPRPAPGRPLNLERLRPDRS